MNKFLKNILSSCLGSLLALTMIIIISAIIISSYTSKSKPNQNGVLHINVNGTISNFQSKEFNFSDLNFSDQKLYLWDLRNKIQAASSDDNIKGIFLEFKQAQLSQEVAMEIAGYITEFKKSGKKIYSYSYFYDQNAYLLSTYGDKIYINPNGEIDLKGYAIYSPFFSALLEKYKIDINIYYAGKYKSSTEPYRLSQFSEENKFQFRTYLNQLKDILVHAIAENRSIDKSSILPALESTEIIEPKQLKAANFINDFMYMDEFKEILKSELGTDELVNFSTYEIPKTKTKQAQTALVFVEGEIVWDGASEGIKHSSIVKTFDKIKKDNNIKQVILRINSPGGSGYASDLIYHEIQQLKASGKKVYASLGEYAASGGYYIASACDSIFASENTLTGSIGVYIMLPTLDRFLKEELLVNVDSIKTNSNAIGYSPILPIDKNEEEKFIKQTEKLYQLFLQRVSDGRKLSIDSIHSIAQGRIWSGKDASEIGLVDKVKTLDNVLRSLENYDKGVKIYPEKSTSILNDFMKIGLGNFEVSSKSDINLISTQLKEFNNLLQKPTPMTRLPKGIFVINQ